MKLIAVQCERCGAQVDVANMVDDVASDHVCGMRVEAPTNRDYISRLKAELEYEKELRLIDREWSEIQADFDRQFPQLFCADRRTANLRWVGIFVSIPLLILGISVSMLVDSPTSDALLVLPISILIVVSLVSFDRFQANRKYNALRAYYRKLRDSLRIEDFLTKETQRVYTLD